MKMKPFECTIKINTDALDDAKEKLAKIIDIIDSMIEPDPCPYQKFRDAHERGEMVQHKSENGKWHNCIHSSGWAFNDDPGRYRIKSKTLYLFAYRDEKTKSWKNTDIYHKNIIDARADILWAVEFKRLDYTAIEVES